MHVQISGAYECIGTRRMTSSRNSKWFFVWIIEWAAHGHIIIANSAISALYAPHSDSRDFLERWVTLGKFIISCYVEFSKESVSHSTGRISRESNLHKTINKMRLISSAAAHLKFQLATRRCVDLSHGHNFLRHLARLNANITLTRFTITCKNGRYRK